MRLILIISFIFSFFIANSTIAQTVNSNAYITSVGMIIRNYKDTSRLNWQGTAPRPLRTVIWYPAAKSAKEDTIFIGPPDNPLFIAGIAARGADISSASQKYPLILLSHGTGGSALQMMWLGSYLAAHGYIAAALNHYGNTYNNLTPQGFVLWWERTEDLSAVLDNLLADPLFGSQINKDRIGAAGFSLGGYTVISLAGGLTNLQAFKEFCASGSHPAMCTAPPEFPELIKAFKKVKDNPRVQASLQHAHDSYRDERVKAIFAISPALGGAFTDKGLAPIDIPVYIVGGKADTIAPVATNARRYAKGIEQATLKVLPRVRHYTFLSVCTKAGKKVLPLYCASRHGIDRAAVHQRVSELALMFFKRSL